jgi:hypothetical protein
LWELAFLGLKSGVGEKNDISAFEMKNRKIYYFEAVWQMVGGLV